MAFPTTPILDNFNRADEPLNTRQNWGPLLQGFVNGSVLTTGFRSVSFAEAANAWALPIGSADQELYCTVVIRPDASGNVRLFVRTTDVNTGTENGYVGQFTRTAWSIDVFTDGAITSTITSGSYSLQDGDSIGIAITGSTIELYHKPSAGAWTLLGSTTDTTWTNGGIGFYVNDPAKAAVLDDVGGGSSIYSAAVAQLVESFRNVRNRSLYHDGERKVVQGSSRGAGDAPASYGWFTHEEIVRVFAQRADLSAHQQSQPAADWMAFAANIFYDPLTMSGWLPSLGNFRSTSHLRYQRDTNRDLAWAVDIQQQLVGLAAISQLSDSFRNVRNRSLYGDGEKKPTQGPGGSSLTGPEYDPQINIWNVDSHRVPGKPYWTSPGPSVDWIEAPRQAQSFDPATHPWAIDSTVPRRTRPVQMSWTKSGFFVALYHNPAQAGWVLDSQRVPGGPWWTSPDPHTDWIDPVVRTPFDTTLRSDVLDSQRVPADPYWTSPWQGNDWLNPGLLGEISFDPQTEDWSIKTNTYRSRAWYSDSPQQQAWMVPAVIFDGLLWPSTAIPSHRELPKAKGLWQPDLDNAWEAENPPVPNFFNASFAPGANTLDQPGGSPERSS